MALTFKQAFRAAIAPYLLPDMTIELLLTQQGLDVGDEYETSEDNNFYQAVINGLYQLKTLKKEKDPASENEYDVDKIDDLIKRYSRYLDDDAEENTDNYFIDRTDEW